MSLCVKAERLMDITIRTIMIGRAIMAADNHSRVLFRNAFLCFALLLNSLSGCSDQNGIPTQIKTYQAYISNSVRTSMADNGDVSWTQGDVIWYFSQNGGTLRSHIVEENAVKIDLSLTLAADASFVTAIYGTSVISDYSAESIRLGNVVKPIQEGTFIDGHVAVARLTNIDEQRLRFHNLVSYIVFSTRKTFIDHIVFSATDDTPLHSNGNVDVHYEEGAPIASLCENGENSIRINISGSGTFCIAVLPVVLNGGFILSCYDSQDKLVGTATGQNTLSVQRGSIVRLGMIDSHLYDENGINLSGYGDDDTWDYSGDSDGSINWGQYGDDGYWDPSIFSNVGIGLGGYGNDVYWGHSGNSQGSMGLGWYRIDYNWDSAAVGSASIDRGEYGNDSDWNTNQNANGGIGHQGYGEDANWN